MGGHLSHLKHEPIHEAFNATCGPITGNIYRHGDKDVVGYVNIPYAKPPIGELRFKKSEPADVWTQERYCHLPGPISPQIFGLGDMIEDRSPEWSEADCLHLSVFAPRYASEEFKSGYPVMVYLHGGGYEFSSSIDYDPYSLSGTLPLKDTVVVLVNYRLGVLGFLTTGDKSCRGNFGLWDQTLALRWVQKHIACFGGNPNNVTLFGQSAGGASADLLSLSPHSRNLFHKMILMSGTAYCEFAIRTSEDQVKVFQEFAEHHGYTGNDSQSLLEWYQRQPPEVLVDTKTFERSRSGWLNFIVNLDGDFLPKPLEELRKEAPKKPVMLGVTEYEGLILGLKSKGSSGTEALQKILSSLFRNDVIKNPEVVQQKLREFYTSGMSTPEEIDKAKVLLLGDLLFNVGVRLTAESTAGAGNPTYLYSFEYCNPDNFGDFDKLLPFKASTHFTDVRYVLGEGLYCKFEPNETDLEMLDKMTTLYSNFAKFGNPNGSGNLGWEEFSVEEPKKYYRIGWPESEMRDDWQGGRTGLVQFIIENGKKLQRIAFGK